MGSEISSEDSDALSLVKVGVWGVGGASWPVGVGVIIQSRGVSLVRVTSDISRLCARVRSTSRASSSPVSKEKEGGSEYCGDSGRGEMGL